MVQLGSSERRPLDAQRASDLAVAFEDGDHAGPIRVFVDPEVAEMAAVFNDFSESAFGFPSGLV